MQGSLNFDVPIPTASDKDITENRHRGNEFSKAAKPKKSTKESQYKLILAALGLHSKGLICEELEKLLDMAHTSCSARLTELKESNRVYVEGTRLTSSNRKAGINHLNKHTEATHGSSEVSN